MLRRSVIVLAACLSLFAVEPNDATRRWWAHVVALSGDDLQGRDTGSEGYKKAARYVVAEFEKAGLKPDGEHGYYQTVPLHETRFLPEQSQVELVRGDGATKLRWLYQIAVTVREGLPSRLDAPLVFMGDKSDDGGDATGKIVVSLNGHAGGNRQGAIAMITIDNQNAVEPPRWPLQYGVSMRLRETKGGGGSVVTMRFNPAEAELLFAGTGHTYKELYEMAEAHKPLPSFPLNASLRASLAFTSADLESDNVLAVLPGSDPVLSKEYVVISAHLDGYGLGEPWGTDNIYNGAFDDAAYVATLIDFAEGLRAARQTTKRSILFCVVTGEEKGLLGSKYFAAHPTLPPAQMVADINLDQLRPIFPLKILTMLAVNESTLGETAKKVAASMDIRIQPDPEPGRNLLRRSDHWNFMQIGVPSTGFIFGFVKGTPDEAAYREWYAKRYHSPLDDLNQPWVPDAAAKFNEFFGKFVVTIADAPDRPKWTPGSVYLK